MPPDHASFAATDARNAAAALALALADEDPFAADMSATHTPNSTCALHANTSVSRAMNGAMSARAPGAAADVLSKIPYRRAVQLLAAGADVVANRVRVQRVVRRHRRADHRQRHEQDERS